MKIGKKQDVIKDYITNTNKIATAKPIKKICTLRNIQG